MEIETKMEIKKSNIDRNSEKSLDFVEGLCRLLSGVTTHLSSTVVRAPLAHVLLVKGSRFQFSHSFSNLLLTQIIDYLDGEKEISFYLRRGYSNSVKEVQWPEMFATNYLERPLELEHVSVKEFVQDYEVKYYGKSKIKDCKKIQNFILQKIILVSFMNMLKKEKIKWFRCFQLIISSQIWHHYK